MYRVKHDYYPVHTHPKELELTMSSEPLLAFKAGRSHRREGTNFVDASPIKGAIYLYNEDGLLHLKWKNRLTNQVEEVNLQISLNISRSVDLIFLP